MPAAFGPVVKNTARICIYIWFSGLKYTPWFGRVYNLHEAVPLIWTIASFYVCARTLLSFNACICENNELKFWTA